jgi:hypothetical protein
MVFFCAKKIEAGFFIAINGKEIGICLFFVTFYKLGDDGRTQDIGSYR